MCVCVCVCVCVCASVCVCKKCVCDICVCFMVYSRSYISVEYLNSWKTRECVHLVLLALHFNTLCK